jgi:hypothetical protein
MTLEERVLEIERILRFAGLMQPEPPKAPIYAKTDAIAPHFEWVGGRYAVDFTYACDCGAEHRGTAPILSQNKDGARYSIKNSECGTTMAVRIIKHVTENA